MSASGIAKHAVTAISNCCKLLKAGVNNPTFVDDINYENTLTTKYAL